MIYRLAWLPTVLRRAGCAVEETPGWSSRGHGDMLGTFAVLLHHTADGPPSAGAMPSLHQLIKGRPDLPGPIANCGLGRDGKWWMIAAGCAWHAGPADHGIYQGLHNGNHYLIGIEIENMGYANPASPKYEAFPEAVLASCATGCAAILDHLGLPEYRLWGHKEWAPSRKVDPWFSMDEMRARVHKARAKVKAYGPDRPPADNVKLAWDTMMLEQYTPEQAAGWIGNAQQESYDDLRTTVVGDRGEACGIFQWHKTRLAELHTYADQQKMVWSDLVTQLRFSLVEPGEKKAHAALQAADTIEQAVDAGILYTRPGRPNRPRRLELANALYHWFVGRPEAKGDEKETKARADT